MLKYNKMANLELVWTQPVLIKIDRDIQMTTFAITLTYDYSFKINSAQTLSISDLSNVEITFRSSDNDILDITTTDVSLNDKTTNIDTYFNTILSDYTSNYWETDDSPTNISSDVDVSFNDVQTLPVIDASNPVDNVPQIVETAIARIMAQSKTAGTAYDASGRSYNTTALASDAERTNAAGILYALDTQDAWRDSIDTFHSASGAGYYFKQALKDSAYTGEDIADLSNNPVADLIRQVHSDPSGADRLLTNFPDVDTAGRLDQVLAAGDSLFVILAIVGQNPTSDLNIYIDSEAASNNVLSCTDHVDESAAHFSNSNTLNDLINVASSDGSNLVTGTSRVPPLALRVRIPLAA